MSDIESDQNMDQTMKYMLEYRLLRHPVIYGSAILFFISLIFFAFGTIKFQSLAIDIDQQGKKALERSKAHIKSITEMAESDIKLAKTTSINNIKTVEITETQNFSNELKPAIMESIKAIRLEAEKAVKLIESEGKDAVHKRIQKLQEKIDQFNVELKAANDNIIELNGIKTQVVDAKPEISQFLNDWESVKNQGSTWKAALINATDNWRKLVLQLIAFGFISGIVSYLVSKRTCIQ